MIMYTVFCLIYGFTLNVYTIYHAFLIDSIVNPLLFKLDIKLEYLKCYLGDGLYLNYKQEDR